MVLCGSAGLSDQHGPSSSVTPGLQRGPRCWPRPWAVEWLSVVTGTMDHNTNPGCGRATDLDMAPRHSSDQPSTWSLGGCKGHSDWHHLSYKVAARHQHRPRWQPRPRVSKWPLMVPSTRTSTQTLALVGPQTQTQSQFTAQARVSPWPWVAAQGTQICMACDFFFLIRANGPRWGVCVHLQMPSSRFQYQSNTGFVEQIWKQSFPFYLLEHHEKHHCCSIIV